MCKKKKFDKIKAMLILAEYAHSGKRDEKRKYWCKYCKSYHLTSQEKMVQFDHYWEDKEFHNKSWPWKQGWLSWMRDAYNYENPHEEGTYKHIEFEDGWEEANFSAAVEGGYYDSV